MDGHYYYPSLASIETKVKCVSVFHSGEVSGPGSLVMETYPPTPLPLPLLL